MRRSAAWNAPQRRFEWPQRRPECVATAGDLPPAANGIVWHNALCAPLSVVSPHCFANYFAHLPFGRAPRAASGPPGYFPAHYTAHLLMRTAAAGGSGPPSYFPRTTPRICLCGMRPLRAAALPVISRSLHRAFVYAECGPRCKRPCRYFPAFGDLRAHTRGAPKGQFLTSYKLQ